MTKMSRCELNAQFLNNDTHCRIVWWTIQSQAVKLISTVIDLLNINSTAQFWIIHQTISQQVSLFKNQALSNLLSSWAKQHHHQEYQDVNLSIIDVECLNISKSSFNQKHELFSCLFFISYYLNSKSVLQWDKICQYQSHC